MPVESGESARPAGVPHAAGSEHGTGARLDGAQSRRRRRGAARRCRRDGHQRQQRVEARRPLVGTVARRAARSAAARSGRTCGKPACASPTAPVTPVATTDASAVRSSRGERAEMGRGCGPAARRHRPRSACVGRTPIPPALSRPERPQRAAVGVDAAGGREHGALRPRGRCARCARAAPAPSAHCVAAVAQSANAVLAAHSADACSMSPGPCRRARPDPRRSTSPASA